MEFSLIFRSSWSELKIEIGASASGSFIEIEVDELIIRLRPHFKIRGGGQKASTLEKNIELQKIPQNHFVDLISIFEKEISLSKILHLER